jgi:hypothetical protein
MITARLDDVIFPLFTGISQVTGAAAIHRAPVQTLDDGIGMQQHMTVTFSHGRLGDSDPVLQQSIETGA